MDEITIDQAISEGYIKDEEYVQMVCNDVMIIAILDVKNDDRFTLCVSDSKGNLKSIFLNACNTRLYVYHINGGYICYKNPSYK